MMNEAQPDMTWSELSDMEGDGLVSAMQQRFEALAGLDQAAREQQSESMIRAEYMLEAELLGDFTEARLRSWMGVAGDNLSRAQDVANAYDKAFERVSGGMAMHHATLVQTIARERFTPEDMDVLSAVRTHSPARRERASGQPGGRGALRWHGAPDGGHGVGERRQAVVEVLVGRAACAHASALGRSGSVGELKRDHVAGVQQ